LEVDMAMLADDEDRRTVRSMAVVLAGLAGVVVLLSLAAAVLS
jgi:hypothetical protein